MDPQLTEVSLEEAEGSSQSLVHKHLLCPTKEQGSRRNRQTKDLSGDGNFLDAGSEVTVLLGSDGAGNQH
jgi:hypothetical protein